MTEVASRQSSEPRFLSPEPDRQAVLSVRDLHVTFDTARGMLPAVEGVSFDLGVGQTLAVVGESGSGKSVMARSFLGLLGRTAIVQGSVRLEGQELVGLSPRDWRQYRGRRLGMVFQDPMRSLNPTMRVGSQIAEALRLHRAMDKRSARDEARSLLSAVRVADAGRVAQDYPHQLSGGMRQRVMIAIALAARPTLLIADEPTTALDVTTQAQILDLIDELKASFDMSVILITHDLGIAAHHSDQLAVMYSGRIVETSSTQRLLSEIRMPYTKGLLEAIPTMDHPAHALLSAIEGRPPDPLDRPAGCAFAPRCARAQDRCREERPNLTGDDPGHAWACWYPLGPIGAQRS
jgi:peptide/nickel transport system ATP-binding protein